jgi:hypothetical protein
LQIEGVAHRLGAVQPGTSTTVAMCLVIVASRAAMSVAGVSAEDS